jgi:hypothetical protein
MQQGAYAFKLRTSVTRHAHAHALNILGAKNYLEVLIQLPTRNNCPLALGWRAQQLVGTWVGFRMIFSSKIWKPNHCQLTHQMTADCRQNISSACLAAVCFGWWLSHGLSCEVPGLFPTGFNLGTLEPWNLLLSCKIGLICLTTPWIAIVMHCHGLPRAEACLFPALSRSDCSERVWHFFAL